MLATATIDAGEFGDEWSFITVPLNGVPDVAATEQLSLVITSDAPSNAPPLEFESLLEPEAGGRLQSNNGGGSWSYRPNESLVHYLYGVVTRPTTTALIHHRFLDATRIRIGRAEAALDVRVPAMNSPELLEPWWDFDDTDVSDPFTYDGNGDGQADWGKRDGGTSLGSSVINLDSRPAMRIQTPVVIEYAASPTASARRPRSNSPSITTAPRPGGSGLVMTPVLGAQRFGLHLEPISFSSETFSVSGLDDDRAIPVRFIVDPDARTVHLTIDGVDRGTFDWTPRASTTVPGGVSLTWTGAGRIEDLTVRVLEPAP